MHTVIFTAAPLTVFTLLKFVKEKLFTKFATATGGLAQLARALAWHARGRRFDSDILHSSAQGLAKICKAFFLSDNTMIQLKTI